jgi:methylenetetrahydrofolate reductase (NADPH)
MRALQFLQALPGVVIPDHVVRRMRGVPEDQMPREALALCSETIQQLREIEGINGVHIIASGDDDFIPEVLTRAGVSRRGYGEVATAAGAGAAAPAAGAASVSGGY